jgi:hypothetical protein
MLLGVVLVRTAPTAFHNVVVICFGGETFAYVKLQTRKVRHQSYVGWKTLKGHISIIMLRSILLMAMLLIIRQLPQTQHSGRGLQCIKNEVCAASSYNWPPPPLMGFDTHTQFHSGFLKDRPENWNFSHSVTKCKQTNAPVLLSTILSPATRRSSNQTRPEIIDQNHI